jgi:integrase
VALYLGALPLRALRADDLRALYARLQAAPGADSIGRGLAPKTIRELHGTVRLALRQAVDDRILERNEALLVRLPRVPRFAPRVLSSAELAGFWRVARGDRLYALWYLASLFPSRAGELRALRWEDVDARARTLTVRRSLERAEDAGRVLRTKAPKTAAGTRLVDLDPALLQALQDHRRHQAAERLRAGAQWVDHGLVFTTRYGTPLDNNNLRRRFRALLGQAGVSAPGAARRPGRPRGHRGEPGGRTGTTGAIGALRRAPPTRRAARPR